MKTPVGAARPHFVRLDSRCACEQPFTIQVVVHDVKYSEATVSICRCHVVYGIHYAPQCA